MNKRFIIVKDCGYENETYLNNQLYEVRNNPNTDILEYKMLSKKHSNPDSKDYIFFMDESVFKDYVDVTNVYIKMIKFYKEIDTEFIELKRNIKSTIERFAKGTYPTEFEFKYMNRIMKSKSHIIDIKKPN